jgi:hypothetical protein
MAPIAPVRVAPKAPSSVDEFFVPPAAKVASEVLFVGPYDAHLMPLLTTEEKTALLASDYVIRDKRATTSVPYTVRVEENITNPTMSGMYEVLTPGGKFEKAVVLHSPYSHRGPEKFCVVIRPDRSDFLNADQLSIWVKQNAGDDLPSAHDTALRKWISEKPEADSLPAPKKEYWFGPYYILAAPDGQCSAPFQMRSTSADGRYEVNFQIYTQYDRPDNHPPVSTYPRATQYRSEQILLTGLEGAYLSTLGGELIVPKGFRLIKVRPGREDPELDADHEFLKFERETTEDQKPGRDPGAHKDHGSHNDWGAFNDRSKLQIGQSADLWLHIVEKTREKQAGLKVSCVSGEIVLEPDGRPAERLGTTGAMRSLVMRHGFSKEAAENILQNAASSATVRLLVKYADGYPLQNMGPVAPAIPEPVQGSAYGMTDLTGALARHPQQEELPVPMPAGAPAIPMNAPPNQGNMQLAQQAAQTGQKDVFDAAMIGSLLRAGRQESMVDQDVRVMDDALDRIGRQIFRFYWHNDKYSDRYGKSELPELEENLLSNFDGMGDLVLFLMNKEIESGPDVSSVDLSDAAYG